MKRWPLVPIAAPAAVAVWSGWVGLGGMCGFGVISPLPGIDDAIRINTAITLPIGVEAYATFALGAWLSPAEVPAAARTFARRSAIGALALGITGQVVYHLLAAAHARTAPWPVVVLVSGLPVVTLGFGAALAHLLRAPAVPAAVPGPVPELDGQEEPHPQLREKFAAEIEARTVPGIARIRAELHCGQPKAQRVQAYLRAITEAA